MVIWLKRLQQQAMLRRIGNSNYNVEKGIKYRNNKSANPYTKYPIQVGQENECPDQPQGRKFNIRQARKVRDDFQKRLESHCRGRHQVYRVGSAQHVGTLAKEQNIKKAMNLWFEERVKGIEHYTNEYMEKVLNQLSNQKELPGLEQCQLFLDNINKLCESEIEENVKKCLV